MVDTNEGVDFTQAYEINLQRIVNNQLEGDTYNTRLIESMAHYVGRLMNESIRFDKSLEVSIPDAVAKLFAPKFFNKNREVKTGEIYELHEIDGSDTAQRLDEAADIVGKYALGIERVSFAQNESSSTNWNGFARSLSLALGFNHDDVLAAFIVKYDSRIKNKKNKEKELNEIQLLVSKRNISPIATEGSLENRLSNIKARYDIENTLNNLNYAKDGNDQIFVISNLPVRISAKSLKLLNKAENSNIYGFGE